MSSLDVAETAASTRIPSPVRSRTMLHEGPIVKILVPVNAEARTYEQDDQFIPYLQFRLGVRGGLMNCFVHTDDESYCGRNVTGRVSLWEKVFSDGRRFLYVDIVPIEGHATHRLAFLPDHPGLHNRDGWDVFKTAPPINALVIFAPLDAKMVPENRPAVEDDRQLMRLLEQGWQMKSEDERTVTLFRRLPGADEKTMVHHRPKTSRRKTSFVNR